MKVFNLACEHEHPFEGWFASGEAFDDQQARGLIECPMCGSKTIRKMPAAPRLNLSAKPSAEARSQAPAAMPTPQQLQAMWTKMARHLMENTEDVGERFAEEARRIHYKEAPERGIRGVATQDERAELESEGIEVLSFPVPRAAKEPLQ
ncbi:MAG: DUF1178 family protein [Burkholderiaceae bacterium]